MSDELTPAQIAGLEQKLLGMRDELERLLDSTKEGTRPVDLDEPIGRLTRMDAIQQQGMAAANRREHDIRLQLVRQALTAIRQERYGLCRRCEEPIGHPRLNARPETSFCVECQDEIDRRQP